MNRKLALIAAFGTAFGAAGVASADFTFPVFNLGPDVGATNTFTGLDLSTIASIPAGNYIGFNMLVDWTSTGNSATNFDNAWSSEARVHFASAAGTGTGPTLPGGTTVHRVVTSPSNGLSNANNLTDLRFSGAFGVPFDGTTPFFLNYRQVFAGFSTQDITWANIRLTLLEPAPPVPGDRQSNALDLGVFGVGDMKMAQGTLASTTNLAWYKFTLNSPVGASEAHSWLEMFTNGSNFDTEMGLYDSLGNRIANNDDEGELSRSALSFGTGSGEQIGGIGFGDAGGPFIGAGQNGATLAAGDYYVVIGGFDTVFGASNFAVTAGAATGNYKLTIVPAPGALALLGLGGLVAARRRRA